MTLSDSNKELFKLLSKQLDDADGLIETWLARPRKSKASDTPEPSDELAYLSQIETLNLIKRYLKSVNKDVNLRPIERIIDAYWDAYEGGKPILFSSPVPKKGGQPTTRKSNEHLAPLAAAVSILKKFEFGTDEASKYIAQLSRLETKRVKQIHKEFSEERKQKVHKNFITCYKIRSFQMSMKRMTSFLMQLKTLLNYMSTFL